MKSAPEKSAESAGAAAESPGGSPWQRAASAQSDAAPVEAPAPADAPAVSLAKSASGESGAAEAVPGESSPMESLPAESVDIEGAEGGNPEGESPDGESADGVAKPSRIRRISRGARAFVFSRRGGAAALVIVVLAVLGTGGWLLWENHQHNQLEAKRNAYIATATQEVLNTLNIQKDSADADVKRILDNASGSFYDQFNSNRDQFVNIVKEAEVNSKGNVIQAALQDISGNTARVLVVGSSEVTNKASPQASQRDYRLRVTVTDDGHRMTVSDMEYVMS
ncbi:hypothetical protein G4X40_15335 [Rhodococcus sp. D2-41]|uniref:Tetratricopeptide repeat protein n=1 Tax=Speluncibacter jeojiensis TaxID=2710754 RepID=A0A9X4RDU8_9ACTN|nr:hypothetical protein [Rhodococcus sp. D2-41]MDG3011519.1 hypothetical protein [Rhodococcus sp. D2-41]MDG3015124.1 tetratricopeptide repeat protein [Corynebacteriales bacterium D3-21]